MVSSLSYSALFLACFSCAIIHSLFAHLFLKKSRSLAKQEDGSTLQMVCKLLGHNNLIFVLWLVPSLVWVGYYHGGARVTEILAGSDLNEPFANFTYIFLALSRTVQRPFNLFVNRLANMIGSSETVWWFCCLLVGIVLDSLISEPAAMVLVCSALVNRYYMANPSPFFCYATLAIVLSTLSIGNLILPLNITASLDLSSNWGWNHWIIASNLSWRAAITALIILVVGAAALHRELSQITPDSDVLKEKSSLSAMFAYLMAFIVTGVFEHIAYILISVVAIICVLEQEKDGQSHANRLKLPLLVALFNYSMEVHSYLLSPTILEFYNTEGVNLSMLTLGLSALNEHLPGLSFISSFEAQSMTAKGFGLMMFTLGSGITLFATSVNILAGKLLRKQFPDGTISGLRFLAYSFPIALLGFLILNSTYLLVP